MTQQGQRSIAAASLRESLRAGGVVVAWCGVGLRHEPATLSARREGARLLAMLQMEGLEGLHVSRSACDGLGAVAVSQRQPVGVDVEALSIAVEDAALMHPNERWDSAASAWVRKEAVLKALGVGLVVAPHELQVRAGDDGGDGVDWRCVDVAGHGTAHVRSLRSPVPHVHAAVAVQEGAWPAVPTRKVQVISGFIEAGDTPCRLIGDPAPG